MQSDGGGRENTTGLYVRNMHLYKAKYTLVRTFIERKRTKLDYKNDYASQRQGSHKINHVSDCNWQLATII